MKLDEFAPLHARHEGDDPRRTRCPASPTATSRSSSGPTTRRRSRTAAQIEVDELDRAGRPRPALQHARRADAHGAPAVRRRAPRRRSTASRREGAESLKYLNPALSTTSQLVNEIISDKLTFERFVSDTSRVVDAVAERRDDLSALVGNANATARRDRRRERRAGPLARRAARHAAQRQHDVREPALDARRPGRAGRRVEARDRAAAPSSSAPCARSCATRSPTVRDLRNADPHAWPGQRPDRADQEGAQARSRCRRASSRARSTRSGESQPVIEYIRPYSPDLAGWFTKFGQAAANYDANGHYARIQPIFNAFQLTPDADRRGPDRHAPVAAARGLRVRPVAALPGRRDAARRPTARTRGRARPRGQLRLRPRDHPARPVRRVATALLIAVGLPALIVFGTGAGEDGGSGYEVRAIFDNASYIVAGRGREGRGRGRRRDQVPRRDRRQAGRDHAQDHGARLHAVPRGRALHDPAAVADRREVRRVHARPGQRARAEEDRGRARRGRAPAARRGTRRPRSTSTWSTTRCGCPTASGWR